MKTKFLLIAFAVMALLQLAIPAQMVWENESAYALGTEYKFKTEPVDPNDPLRGKYIALNFEAGTLPVKEDTFQSGEKLYALLAVDKDGFAQVTKLQREIPATGDYLLVDCGYNYGNMQHFELPFNRFYMEESKAPEAEKLYQEHNSGEQKIPAYAIVSVNGEVSVIKDVILGGMPIKEYVEKHQDNPNKKID